jgi:endonuclease/exonuclease/phosphatase (EEP) superfamily protein YafD
MDRAHAALGTLDVNGTQVEVVGVHLARPFYPRLQEEDIEALTSFVLQREGPLVLAGDFNMSPWTEKLGRLTYLSGLRRFTWPMRRGRLQLLPFVAIDNVLVSPHFTTIAIAGGPRLGSDHRAVTADLALAGAKRSSRGIDLPAGMLRAMLTHKEDKP